MREVLERLIAEFDIEQMPKGTPREVELPSIEGKVDAVIGMRRSGKTWRLFQEIHRSLGQGTPPQDILHLSFEDERLLPIEVGDLHWITDAFQRRRTAEHGATDSRVHLFLDEIQNVPSWERWIRRLLDERQTRIVLSGSSAKLLSQELATSMRGRSLSTELLPFSFAEVLRHEGVAIPQLWPPKAEVRHQLGLRLESYLFEGGFPEIQGKPARVRVRILQDYIDVVLLRDVVERHRVENFTALRYLQRSLLSRPSNRFSIHKLHNDLKSQGLRVSKTTLHDYLGHLEDAYLLFTTEIYSKSLRIRRVNPRKVYPVDPGLSAAISFEARGDVGHLLETVVYLELRRRGFQMTWLRTESGYEVDFFARGLLGQRLLVQVAADMSSESTRKREVRALQEAMSEHRFDSAVVVTMRDYETIDVEQGTIRVVPAWRWLLEDRGI